MDCSRHTVTKYVTDEKTHCAINCKIFKCPYDIIDQLYKIELVKPEIEHREPITVELFVLQNAKHRLLEL